MGILSSVKVDAIYHISVTGVDYRDSDPMSEPAFEIDATSSTVLAVCEVSDEKARAANLSYDLIVYLIDIGFLIDPKGRIACFSYTRLYAVFEGLISSVMKPHRYKCL